MALQLAEVSKALFERLVSSELRYRLDPILYRVVGTQNLYTAIQTRGPEAFARNDVKTLVFDGHWWPPDSVILHFIFSAGQMKAPNLISRWRKRTMARTQLRLKLPAPHIDQSANIVFALDLYSFQISDNSTHGRVCVL
ncbi:hypothetical protein BDZ89DRAFT_492128 [Hymenopellis radicata]|nr:hypothetical protein BDZ89DRAFT_492128 [Hymenopellis radicata]